MRPTFGVADDGLTDVVLLQAHLCQPDPLLAVGRVQVGGDEAELQRLVHVLVVLVDHRKRGERLVGQRSWKRRFGQTPVRRRLVLSNALTVGSYLA